jgi:hypothetical protein
MNKPSDDDVKIDVKQIQFLYTMLEKMQRELPEAEGQRKKALLKLIDMGQKRLVELKRTFH